MAKISELKIVANGLIDRNTYVYAGDIPNRTLSRVMDEARPYEYGMTYNGVKLTSMSDNGIGKVTIGYDYRQSLSEGVSKGIGGGFFGVVGTTIITAASLGSYSYMYDTLSSSVTINYDPSTELIGEY